MEIERQHPETQELVLALGDHFTPANTKPRHLVQKEANVSNGYHELERRMLICPTTTHSRTSSRILFNNDG